VTGVNPRILGLGIFLFFFGRDGLATHRFETAHGCAEPTVNAADELAESEPAETSLKELMTRAQAGSREAFSELWGRLERFVHSRCLLVVRNSHDAQEVAQDVALSAWKYRDQCRHSVHGWIRAIAYQKSLTRIGARIPMRSLNVRTDKGVAPIDLIPDPGLNPEERALLGEMQKVANDAIENLSDEFGYRTVARLFYTEGLSLKEIAERHNRPIGTLTRQLSQIRERVAAPLAQFAEIH